MMSPSKQFFSRRPFFSLENSDEPPAIDSSWLYAPYSPDSSGAATPMLLTRIRSRPNCRSSLLGHRRSSAGWTVMLLTSSDRS